MDKSTDAGLLGGRRRAMLVSACLIPATCIHAAESEPKEEVIVTGSRIARASDFENPSPVITVDRESIEKSGYNNLQQLMEKLPANGNGAFSTRGNNQDSTANGAASISLRGLGADATLVLVNGRRVAISSFAENVTTSFVDINSIPVAAIERVEVLKDGSSAVYGSDAVAGVVNIILRKDFTGFEASASFGSVTEGSYDETNVSAIFGMGDDDTHVTLMVDYFNNSTLANSERWYFGTANQTSRGGQDFRSSRGYPGRFIVNGANRIDPNCPAGSIAGQTCLYDFGPWNLLTPEAERAGVMLLAQQDVSDSMQFFTEIGFQHNDSSAQGAPTPLDETAGLTVPVTHPNNPFAGASSIQIGRYRTVDAGPRQWDISSKNLRGVLGLRGDVGDWKWEVAGQKGRSESTQTGSKAQGWVRTDWLQQEINAGRYNPFGGVQNPESVIDAITTSLERRGESELNAANAEISGDLFDMPAGALKIAAGAEYRDESVSDIPDDQFQRGLIFGTEAVSAAASRNSWAAYLETSIPLLESLELSLAVRYDDYSDFGNTTNPKVAVRWAPVEQLAFRASWGTGFRAPSLAQIGLGPSQSSQFFIDTYGCADNPVYCASTDYNLVFSGNPDLEAEESETFNVGIAWQPSNRTNVTLDYWDIKQEKKIDQVPFGFLYTEFCNVQDSTVCTRGAPLPGDTLGPLQTINTTFVNINEQSTSGLDLGATVGMDVGAGALSFGLNYTHLLDFDRVELAADGLTFVTRSLAGEYEYPEDRAMLWGDYGSAAWGVYVSVNYIGPFQDMPDADFDGTLDYDTVDTRDVGEFTTVNVQLRYTGFEGLQLLLGLDNAFDEQPPFAVGNGDDDLYGYVQSQHNPRGQFWNFKAIYRF